MKSFNEFEVIFSDFFGSLSDSQKVAIWNLYQDYNKGDDQIYNNDEEFFNLYFGGKAPLEVAKVIEGTNWTSYHDYVKFNGRGNIEAIDDVDEVIYVDEIAEFAYNDMSFLYVIIGIDDGVPELIEFLEDIN